MRNTVPIQLNYLNAKAPVNNILKSLRTDLTNLSDEKTKSTFQRFFKETVMFYGVRSKVLEEINKRHFEQIKGWSKEQIFEICEELFKSNYSEEAWIAANWSYKVHKEYKPEDIKIFEKWIEKYVNDWAKCDTLCNHSVGELIEMYPELVSTLKEWSHSTNRWMKRASAVSLIIPAKKGMFEKDIFEIADTLLLDKDDMVQKGYGWMLKELSKTKQQEVFEYVVAHKSNMPRTALRYAIEKMPQELRQEAMKK